LARQQKRACLKRPNGECLAKQKDRASIVESGGKAEKKELQEVRLSEGRGGMLCAAAETAIMKLAIKGRRQVRELKKENLVGPAKLRKKEGRTLKTWKRRGRTSLSPSGSTYRRLLPTERRSSLKKKKRRGSGLRETHNSPEKLISKGPSQRAIPPGCNQRGRGTDRVLNEQLVGGEFKPGKGVVMCREADPSWAIQLKGTW